MASPSYRVPCEPLALGQTVDDEDMCIIHAMPDKSLITYPQSGVSHKISDSLVLHGHAWSGDTSISKMRVSIDYGRTWEDAKLEPPKNRLAWQNFDHTITFPTTGYYEVWACAEDALGYSQPMVLPSWNPKG